MALRLTKMLGLEAPKSEFRTDQASALTSMKARAPMFRTIQQRGTGIVGKFLPQQVQTGQSLLDYYKAGPDEGGMNAEDTAALRTVDNGYATGVARIKALGARTGADTTGALATLESNRAASAFPIQQSLTTRRRAETERFKRGALATASNLAATGAGIEQQGLQGGQALDGQIFSTSGSLAAAEEARKQATYNRIMAFVQQAGQIAGGAYGSVKPWTPWKRSGKTGQPANLGAGENVVQGADGEYLDISGDPFDPYGQPGGDGYNYSYYPGGY